MASELLLKRMRELRSQFALAYQDGLNAMEFGDYRRLGEAIREEGRIIEQQRALCDQLLSSEPYQPQPSPEEKPALAS